MLRLTEIQQVFQDVLELVNFKNFTPDDYCNLIEMENGIAWTISEALRHQIKDTLAFQRLIRLGVRVVSYAKTSELRSRIWVTELNPFTQQIITISAS